MIERYEHFTPRIDPTAWVHPSAVVIGEVEIGARVGVWPTCVLRGDMGLIRIGDETNVQDGTICHDTGDISETLVGRRCTIGHRVVLHGCIVEDECLIGMGAVVMDNARVGRGSLVAAGTLLTPGVEIPPGSLVMGSPGRVVRAVGPRERGMIDNAWRTYVGKLESWRAGRSGPL